MILYWIGLNNIINQYNILLHFELILPDNTIRSKGARYERCFVRACLNLIFWLDIVTSGNILFDDVAFGEFGDDFLFVPAQESYQIDVTPADDNSTIVASYILDLSFWKGKTATIFATGSLLEGTFQPWVALSNGGTYPLPAKSNAQALIHQYQQPFNLSNTVKTNIAPNPARNFTNINYHTETDSRVRIELYNRNGQLMQQMDYGIEQAGYYSKELDITNIPSGMYFMRITSDNNTNMHPLIKIE